MLLLIMPQISDMNLPEVWTKELFHAYLLETNQVLLSPVCMITYIGLWSLYVLSLTEERQGTTDVSSVSFSFS